MSCDSPHFIRHPVSGEQIPVSCGRCPPCQKRRVSQWAFRLREEEKRSTSCLFITLTFNTKYVPISPKGFMTLDKEPYQLFMKRLRKASPPEPKIKYYAVGEYGSKTYRPHFHAIMFNADKDLIIESWKLGDVHVGEVSAASVAYTLKYINKGSRIPMHANDDRQPEFSLMSKGLGLDILPRPP